MTRTLSILIFLVACGGKPRVTTTPSAQDDHAEMASMPPALARFHDRLAALGHAPDGPDPMKKVCLATTDLAADADAIAKASPPANTDAAAWARDYAALLNAVRALTLSCADQTGFDAAFTEVQESFHQLLDVSPARAPFSTGSSSR